MDQNPNSDKMPETPWSTKKIRRGLDQRLDGVLYEDLEVKGGQNTVQRLTENATKWRKENSEQYNEGARRRTARKAAADPQYYHKIVEKRKEKGGPDYYKEVYAQRKAKGQHYKPHPKVRADPAEPPQSQEGDA